MKLGFLINPIAGMGGRVGLKGTDGVLAEALVRGATEVSGERSLEALRSFVKKVKTEDISSFESLEKIEWYTCKGKMGQDILENAGILELNNNTINIIYEPVDLNKTTAKDTKQACQIMENYGIELILFCGGDGTARDIFLVIGDRLPILGIPSGVKMHSGVFATHANVVGELIFDFISGKLDIADGEILDLDEESYRAGDWNVRLFGIAKTPHEPSFIQRGKHIVESASEDEVKDEIAEYIKEEMEENLDTMFILGSGSTVQAVLEKIDINGTLLGIDAVYQGKLIGKDLNEKQILDLLGKYPKVRLILSPIGAQGFILGRGNLQLSPQVIRKIGLDNIDILSTPTKLNEIEFLCVDTNDIELDSEFTRKGWVRVVIGYRQMRLKKLKE